MEAKDNTSLYPITKVYNSIRIYHQKRKEKKMLSSLDKAIDCLSGARDFLKNPPEPTVIDKLQSYIYSIYTIKRFNFSRIIRLLETMALILKHKNAFMRKCIQQEMSYSKMVKEHYTYKKNKKFSRCYIKFISIYDSILYDNSKKAVFSHLRSILLNLKTDTIDLINQISSTDLNDDSEFNNEIKKGIIDSTRAEFNKICLKYNVILRYTKNIDQYAEDSKSLEIELLKYSWEL